MRRPAIFFDCDGVLNEEPGDPGAVKPDDISVIAGACPMMFGPGADFGHTCMRWLLKFTGGLPA